MNIYGYPVQHCDNHAESLQLVEITLCATPNELRQISDFLSFCVTEMERMGDEYDHLHLGDKMKEFNNSSPHFVVVKA